MGVYRLELASSGRAVCKNKECKDNKVKIEKGSLRFCTQVDIGGNQSWAYKHWGCVTPAQIQNLNNAIENNLDYLDGYDELDSELQAIVEKALKEGHVDDSDWRGDVEQNRPGSKGVRKPAPKKKHTAKENAADTDGSHTASRSAPTKRGRGKVNEDGDDDDADGPPPKKTKVASKRNKNNAAKDVDAVEPHAKKTTAVPMRTKKMEIVDAPFEPDTEAPKPKKGPRKEKRAEPRENSDLVGRKKESTDLARLPATQSSRPQRQHGASQKSGPDESGTEPESGASERDNLDYKPKPQRHGKRAAGETKKPNKSAVRAGRVRDA